MKRGDRWKGTEKCEQGIAYIHSWEHQTEWRRSNTTRKLKQGLAARQAYRIEIPGRVWQPLFRPAPVFIFAGDSEALVEGDAVLIVARRRNAVEDGARSAGVFVRAEVHIGSVAVPVSHQHAAVEWIAPQNPMQLIVCVDFE